MRIFNKIQIFMLMWRSKKMTKKQDLIIDLVLNDHNIYTLKNNEYDQEWNLNMKMLSDWGNNLMDKEY